MGPARLMKQKSGALPSLASAADFVSPDSAGAAGETNTTQCVGVREPSMKHVGEDDVLDHVEEGAGRIMVSKVPDSTSTTTDAKTLSKTKVEALPSLASAADFVSPDSVGAVGDTNTTQSVGVREPFKDDRCGSGAIGVGKVDVVELLRSFPLSQFEFEGDLPDFSKPGAIDLFSGCRGVAKSMVKFGAPWVLTFDIGHSIGEDLLDEKVREKIRWLLMSGHVKSLGMAPICASFSKAITPPVRSNRYPRGKPGLSKAMRKKVSQGNSHASFCIELILLCQEYLVAYFLENPDGSWMWKQRGFKEYDDPGSLQVFRLCFCRFGTPWRKATKIATSTRLRGLRMMCTCKRNHFPLRGFSQVHRKMWTKVAEPYPRGLARLLALGLCCQAGWCEQKRLNVAACSKSRSLRAGEAMNPGPRGAKTDRCTLEDLPLLSGQTQALEAKQLGLFVSWCEKTIKTIKVDELFDKVPGYAGQCLRCYGDILFQHGGALSNYRHCILALQRWKPLCRPFMHGPWELVRRWEFQEPVTHRPPLPEGIVKGLISLAWQLEWYEWCGVTLLAFYGAGRLGEVLRCLRKDLILPCDTVGEINFNAYLELRRFKSLHRQPAKIQHMRISDAYCVKLLNMIYGSYSGDWLLFSGSAGQYRRRWDFLLSSFGVDSSLRLTPGGLRGGSAVWAYRNGLGIQQILWNLRLRHQATLESYLQETASLTVFSSLSASSRLSFRRAAMIFDLLCHSANRQGDAAAS